MDSLDPQAQFATRVVQQLRDAGADAFWAGGCVRDLMRGAAPGDYDVATSALPDQVRTLFGRKRTLAVGEAFGVIIVLPPSGLAPVEVATFRTEGPYRDGRRPESVAFATAEEDAQRRDFTINGMFYDPLVGQVLDYVGGQADLEAGIVRAIGDPHERMREDKLRLLRAVRFTAVLDFRLDPVTADAVREMSAELSVVSVERIAQELRKMLVHPNRRRAVDLCRELGLLNVIVPGCLASDDESATTLACLERLEAPSFGLALAVLLRAIPNPVPMSRKAADDAETVRGLCRRLKLSNDEVDSCLWLHAHQDEALSVSRMSDAELKRLLAHPLSGELLQWFQAQAAFDGQRSEGLRTLQRRSANWSRAEIDPPPFVTGQDVLGLGLKPGPRVKELLETLRTAQLNGEIGSRDDALRLLQGQVERSVD